MNLRFISFVQAAVALAFVLSLAPLLSAQPVINATAGKVGVTYSYTVNSSASVGSIYSATGLPPGLGISSSQGTITGTPVASGEYTGSVSITDPNGFVNSATIIIPITAAEGTPTITSAVAAAWTVGVAITPYTVTASVPSGANPVTSFNIGVLPPGLTVGGTSLAPTLTGTPTASGSYSVALSANSATGTGATTALAITVAPALTAPVISGSNAVTVAIGGTVFYAIAASNSPTSYEASGLPVGLTLNTANGEISGIASVSGVYAVALSASNASGASAPFPLTLTVGAVPVVSSPLIATVNAGMPFSYPIAASNTPSSFNIGNLPAGLSANTTTGVITGTAVAAGTSNVSISANNASGTGPGISLAITVGNAPTLTSPLTTSGTVGTSLSYVLNASNSPTGYSVGPLPAGLTYNSANRTIAGTPTAPGTTSVSISASNATGAGPASVLVVSIAAPPSSGGGSSGSFAPVAPAATPPVIVNGPVAQAVIEGSTLNLSVSATGSALSFQWFKDGSYIPGAESATFSIARASAANAGTYYVYVANAAAGVNSANVVVTVNPVPAVGPTIVSQPTSTSVTSGETATLTVAASGTGPLSYQWSKDGVPVPGATSSTLSLAGITSSQAGSYTVAVTNAVGGVTSDSARITVSSPSATGTYFGSFGGGTGSFGLLVRPDRSAVFLGYVSSSQVPLFSQDITISPTGTFAFTQRNPSLIGVSVDDRVRAAAENEINVAGVISADGRVSGSISSLNLTFSAPAGAVSGPTSTIAGFYPAGAAGSSAQSLSLIGPAGDALVVTTRLGTVDGGRGVVAADGAISVTTSANVVVSGSVIQGVLSLRAGATQYVGTTEPRNERLLNVSTRSLTGAGGDTLIAGFVVTGDEPKSVLIRGVGPSLAAFGVNGALSAVRLEVFRDQTSIAVGTDWGAAANNPNDVAAVSARVGAFALEAASRDAALVLTLRPGAYSAVVTGQSGASGIALVEVYDASTGSIPLNERVVNIATRATAGAGENALIAGFYVGGSAPKRVLIRGIGPALAQFGVAGALARPQLSIASGAVILAENAGLASAADAEAIIAASVKVGAFALPANAVDAAILINLLPGAYTGQVSGADGTAGVALIELYEVP